MKKSYFDKVNDIILNAKKETIRMMEEKGIQKLDIRDQEVMVFSFNSKKEIDKLVVTEIFIEEGIDGEKHLYWDYEGQSPWYENRLLWLDVYEAVYRKLNVKRKRRSA